jgi:hypothetical protein
MLDENAIAVAEPGNSEALAAEEQIDADAIRAEVDAMEVADLPRDQDEATVLRYLRRRSQVQAEITHIKDQTQALLRSLESKLNGLDFVYTPIAQDFARRRITGKAKSIKTPFGTVGFRTLPGGPFVSDETALIETALSAPPDSTMWGMVEMVPRVKRAAINEHFKQSGELFPGCDVKAAEEKFYVR